MKKDGSWRECPYYGQLNKMIVKDKFPILVIDELLDEFHEVDIFTKLDLHSRYHQIRMRKENFFKTNFRNMKSNY